MEGVEVEGVESSGDDDAAAAIDGLPKARADPRRRCVRKTGTQGRDHATCLVPLADAGGQRGDGKAWRSVESLTDGALISVFFFVRK